MSWEALPPEARETIRHTLTPRQLDAVRLRLDGAGLERIALAFGVTVSAVRSRLEAAQLKLRKALPELRLELIGAGRDSHRGHIAASQPAHVRAELVRHLRGHVHHSLSQTGPLEAWLDSQDMLAEQRRVVAEAVQESTSRDLPRGGTAAGDPRRLRGLPAIGPSVSGAIPGTQPERETLRRAARDDQTG